MDVIASCIMLSASIVTLQGPLYQSLKALSQEGKTTIGKGGTSLQLDINNKPALYNSNAMSQTLFTLAACGLNVPHVHPRAGKVVFVLQGLLLSAKSFEYSSSSESTLILLNAQCVIVAH